MASSEPTPTNILRGRGRICGRLEDVCKRHQIKPQYSLLLLATPNGSVEGLQFPLIWRGVALQRERIRHLTRLSWPQTILISIKQGSLLVVIARTTVRLQRQDVLSGCAGAYGGRREGWVRHCKEAERVPESRCFLGVVCSRFEKRTESLSHISGCGFLINALRSHSDHASRHNCSKKTIRCSRFGNCTHGWLLCPS